MKTFDFDSFISIFFLGLEDKATEIKVCSSLVWYVIFNCIIVLWQIDNGFWFL